MSAVGCPQLVACVVGLSRSNKKDSIETEEGIGKSCLCHKFMYPGVDNFNDDHRSLFALHEFESPVLNNTHFLYWGHTVKEFDSKSSKKTTGILFHVVEQTVIYQDITLRPFNTQVSKPNVPDHYLKRITGQIESSGKISYKSRDDVALRSPYQQYPSGISRYPRGYLLVMDVSQSGKAFEEQFTRAEIVLSGLQKQKKMFVIVATKRDNHNPSSLERVVALKRKYHTQVVETSALDCLNIDVAFQVLAHKVLHKKVPGLTDHVPTYEEAVHDTLMAKSSAKQSFHKFLKKRIVDSDERYRAIEDNEECRECILHAGKLQSERLFAEHVLELHSQKILLYTGVKENPELREEYLMDFVEQRSDLAAHRDVLQRWIDAHIRKIAADDEPDTDTQATVVADHPAPEPEPYHFFHPNPDSVKLSPALPRASYEVIHGESMQKEHNESYNSDGDLSDREYENYDPKNPTLKPNDISDQPLVEGSKAPEELHDAVSELPEHDYDNVDPSLMKQGDHRSNHLELSSNDYVNSATQEYTNTSHEQQLPSNKDENVYQNQDPVLLDGEHPPIGNNLPGKEPSPVDLPTFPKESKTPSTEDSRPEADQGAQDPPNQSIKQKAVLLEAMFKGSEVESDSPQPLTDSHTASAKPEAPSLPAQQTTSQHLLKDDSPESEEQFQSKLHTHSDDIYVNQSVEAMHEESEILPTSVVQNQLVPDIPNTPDRSILSNTTIETKRPLPPPPPPKVNSPKLRKPSDTEKIDDPTSTSNSVPLPSQKPSIASGNNERRRLTEIKKRVEEKRRQKVKNSSSQIPPDTKPSPTASSASAQGSSPSTGSKKPPPPVLPKPATHKHSDTNTDTSPHRVLMNILDDPPPIPPPPKPEDLVDSALTEVLPPPLPNRTQEMFELLTPTDNTLAENDTPPSPVQNSKKPVLLPQEKFQVPPSSPLQSSIRKVVPLLPQGITPSSPLQNSPQRLKKSTSPDKLLPSKSIPENSKSPSMSHRELVTLKSSPAPEKKLRTAEKKAENGKPDSRTKRKKYPIVRLFERRNEDNTKETKPNLSPETHSGTVPATTFIRMDRRPLPPEPFVCADSDEGEEEDAHDYVLFGPDYDQRDYVNIKDEMPQIPLMTRDDLALQKRAGISKSYSFGAADRRMHSPDDYHFRDYKIPIPFQQSPKHVQERRAPVPQGVWPDYVDGYVNTEINPSSSLPIFRQPLPMVPPERSGYPDYDYPDMRKIMFRTLPTRSKPSSDGVKRENKKRAALENVNWEEPRARPKSTASEYIPMASISMDDSYVNSGFPSSQDTSCHNSPAQLPQRVTTGSAPPQRRYSNDDMTIYMNLPAPPSRVPVPPRNQRREPIQKPKPRPRTRGRSSTDVTLHDPSVLINERVTVVPTNELIPPRNIRRET